MTRKRGISSQPTGGTLARRMEQEQRQPAPKGQVMSGESYPDPAPSPVPAHNRPSDRRRCLHGERLPAGLTQAQRLHIWDAQAAALADRSKKLTWQEALATWPGAKGASDGE